MKNPIKHAFSLLFVFYKSWHSSTSETDDFSTTDFEVKSIQDKSSQILYSLNSSSKWQYVVLTIEGGSMTRTTNISIYNLTSSKQMQGRTSGTCAWDGIKKPSVFASHPIHESVPQSHLFWRIHTGIHICMLNTNLKMYNYIPEYYHIINCLLISWLLQKM